MQRVEAALAEDPELARRYELVREELGQTIHLNETLGAPSARAMRRCSPKSTPSRRARPASIDLGARIGEFFAGLSPRALAWSASAAALAIVLQAGLIAGMVIKERSAGGYETASAPTTIPARAPTSDPVSAAGQRCRYHAVPGNQQTQQLRAVRPRAGSTGSASRRPKLAKPDLDRIVKTLQEDKVVGFIAATE